METANNQVVEVLKYIGEQFGIAIDWTSNNILPYLESLILRIAQYEFYSSIVLASIGFLISIVLLILLVYLCKKAKQIIEEYCDPLVDCGIGTMFLISLIGMPVSFGIACGEVNDIIQAKCLPEITAINYVQQTMQKANVD